MAGIVGKDCTQVNEFTREHSIRDTQPKTARFWSDLRDISQRLPGRNPVASNRPILHDPHNQHSSATLIINLRTPITTLK